MTKISFLPSIFTLASLFLGYLALMQIVKGNFVTAVYLITGSVILDGFDGTVARLTKTESNFGVQLDSLVDGVTFGFVTAIMIYMWGFQESYPQLGKVVGFVFLSAGIIRLARFNVLKEAETYVANVFIGMPIPLAALSVGSVVLLFKTPLSSVPDIIAFSLFVVLTSFLMISNVKYRTMKRIDSKHTPMVLLFLGIMVAMFINFPAYTVPALALLYLISPVFFFIVDKLKRKPHQAQAPQAPTPQAPPADAESKES